MRVLSSEMFSSLPTLLQCDEKIALDISKRPRRNRKKASIRSLVQETHLHPSQFVAPLFVLEGSKKKVPIASMPGVFRFSLDQLKNEVEELLAVGINAIDLFAVIPKEKKDPLGSEALRDDNLLVRSILELKKEFPELCIMADVALDPFTSHGHDGLTDAQGNVVNDSTVYALGKMSLLLAHAGVDVIAPSDMMDGRVSHIRKVLDAAGYADVSILSYAAKYASAFYGPFREALDSAPKFGDKKGYQMNPANRREAVLECLLDEAEGADMLLIKPALAYLDVIAEVRRKTSLPIGGYHVSGEYAMVKAAADKGWIDGNRVMAECLLSIKRAGADFIFTYAAKEMAVFFN